MGLWAWSDAPLALPVSLEDDPLARWSVAVSAAPHNGPLVPLWPAEREDAGKGAYAAGVDAPEPCEAWPNIAASARGRGSRSISSIVMGSARDQFGRRSALTEVAI